MRGLGGRIGALNLPGEGAAPGGVWLPDEVAALRAAGRWGDPHWDSVTALLLCRGANGSTSFVDVKGHTFTANGNAQISTAQLLWGEPTGLLDGTGDYLSAAASADFGFGAGDYTVDVWIKPDDAAGDETIFDNRIGGEGIALYACISNQNNRIGVANNSAVLATGVALPAGQWSMLSIAKQGTALRVFAQGMQQFEVTDSRTYGSSLGVHIGANSTAAQFFAGRFKALRITKGVARWTGNFRVLDAPPFDFR